MRHGGDDRRDVPDRDEDGEREPAGEANGDTPASADGDRRDLARRESAHGQPPEDDGPAPNSWPQPAPPSERDDAAPSVRPATDMGYVMRRVGAYLIDSILIAIVAVLVGSATGAVSAGPGELTVDPAFTLWVLVLEALYRWALQSAFGFTLGKLALGLRVVRAYGGRAGPIRVLIREFVLAAILGIAQSTGQLMLPAIVQVVLLFFVIQRTDNRSLHDIPGITRVVRASSVDSADFPLERA